MKHDNGLYVKSKQFVEKLLDFNKNSAQHSTLNNTAQHNNKPSRQNSEKDNVTGRETGRGTTKPKMRSVNRKGCCST